ncbi:MAG: hypothetical protein LBG87_02510 [Spirochaetaceae bacterium]|nr:hypothetical protein [Spirochaetaceae bacterium]
MKKRIGFALLCAAAVAVAGCSQGTDKNDWERALDSYGKTLAEYAEVLEKKKQSSDKALAKQETAVLKKLEAMQKDLLKRSEKLSPEEAAKFAKRYAELAAKTAPDALGKTVSDIQDAFSGLKSSK